VLTQLHNGNKYNDCEVDDMKDDDDDDDDDNVHKTAFNVERQSIIIIIIIIICEIFYNLHTASVKCKCNKEHKNFFKTVLEISPYYKLEIPRP
jgi:hypothetical protein